MAKETPQEKSTNQILIEQLMQNVGKISTIIEKQGQSIFRSQEPALEQRDQRLQLEFLELLTMLLHAGDKLDRRGAEYKALRQFFANFSQQIQVRGGDMDEFVRYVHFLQRVFLENLEADKSISFEKTREILMLLGVIFNDIILDVFHIYLEGKEKTIQAQQEELRKTSTPITEIWDGVLTLPIIGSLGLLAHHDRDGKTPATHRIGPAARGWWSSTSHGVMAIDSQVSHHLIPDDPPPPASWAPPAILTGIRPEIARALTSLNIDLSAVTTRSKLSEGLKEAFRQLHIEVSRPGKVIFSGQA